MPRQNAPRPISELRGEGNLARRIEHERESRGWSYKTLAEKMAEVGCPIDKSALHRIEAGDPPRKITVNELVALAEVFGLDNINDMLLPLQAVLRREALELAQRQDDAQRGLLKAIVELVESSASLIQVAVNFDSDEAEFKWNHLQSIRNSSAPPPPLLADLGPGRLSLAYNELVEAAVEVAEAVAVRRG